jgi:hypothetical protein
MPFSTRTPARRRGTSSPGRGSSGTSRFTVHRRPFCACGWSVAGEDWQTAVDSHLREAWPVLNPRLDGEIHEQWRDRVAAEHAAAVDDRERAWDRNYMGRGVQLGVRIPVVPYDYSAADASLEVLKHQLDDLTERLNRSGGTAVSGRAAAAEAGQPLAGCQPGGHAGRHGPPDRQWG